MGSLYLSLPASVERIVKGHPHAREAVCKQGVKALKGRISIWPVRTGRSKRAWRVSGSGSRARIFNPINYASYVEQQNSRPARRTLLKVRTKLIKTAEAEIF